MRILIASSFLLSSSLLRLCGSDAPPAPPVTTAVAPPAPAPVAPPGPVAPPATTPPAGPSPTPDGAAALAPVMPISATRFGGTVIPVGNQSVEVIPMSDGQLVAYVNDASGNPLSAPGDTAVAVRMGSSSQPITLAWQETDLRFAATMTDVPLSAGPVEVTLTKAGQSQSGRAELVSVVQPPAHGGVVLAVGNYSSEVLAKSDGTVFAYLLGPQGTTVADPQLQVVASVAGSNGASTPVALTFDPTQAAWVGRVPPESRIAAGPVVLAVTSAGATAQGRFESCAPITPPEHGGTVVSTGAFGVEVVPAASGEVEAFLKDSDGAAPPPDGFQVTVNFETGPRPEPVVLVWNADRRRFVGRARAGIRVERAPLQVQLTHRGHRVRGRYAMFGPPRMGAHVTSIPMPPPFVQGTIEIPPPPVVGIGIRPPPPPPVIRGGIRPPSPPSVGIGIRPPAPPSVRVDVRPPPPPARGAGVQVEVRPPRGGVQVDIGGHGHGHRNDDDHDHGKRPSKQGPEKRRGGLDIRARGSLHIGH